MESNRILRNSTSQNIIGKHIFQIIIFIIKDQEEINNERIQNKIKLRRHKINTILFSKRKINESKSDKIMEIEVKPKKIEDILIPSDFQLKVYKYYENVIFL